MKTNRESIADAFIVIGLVIIGIILRLQFLARSNYVVDADEAIVGLMAKHIIDGRPWTVFYYGQHYMGSLEAILVSLCFKIVGVSSVALRFVPLLFSGFHIALVYALARRVTDRFGSVVAALLTAFAPSALMLWSTKARGGFIELVVIGTFALILSSSVLIRRQQQCVLLFFLGVVLGLGWWVNNQIIFYMLPIGFLYVFHFLREAGVVRTIKLGMLGVTGFLIGGAPFWYANLFTKPQFQSFWLFQRASFSEALSHFGGFFKEALPIILGSRRFWSTDDMFPGSTLFVFSIYALVLLVVIVNVLKSNRTILPGQGGQKLMSNRLLCLLLLFCLVLPFTFSASRFGSLSQAPRYLLPMYSVLFVLVGYAASICYQSKRWIFRVFACVLVICVAYVHAKSNYANGGVVPGQPFVHKGQRVATDHRELYSWLLANNYSHVHTNYWIGYRVAFETDESITFSRYRGPKVIRIPDYEQIGKQVMDPKVYVLVKSEADLVSRGFSDLGYDFRRTELDEYSVIDHVRRDVLLGKKVEMRGEQVVVSSTPEAARFLVDGDLGSRWGSGTAQKPGMSVKIMPDSLKTYVGVDIDYGFWLHDAPLDLTIEAQDLDGKWCMLFDTRNNAALDYVLEGERTWEIRFPPRDITSLRLVQHGSHEAFDWSMAEISIFEVDNH